MDDPEVDGLLRQLGSRDAREAWRTFLEVYSRLLLDVVRHFEHEQDDVADCYVFVCEQLSRNSFRRLRHFKPDGPARFSTWLTVVTRNLCLDWHRRQVGRERVFESVGQMSALDQQTFRCLYVELLSAEELLAKLKAHFPALEAAQAADSVDRVERALTSRQRWLMTVRRHRALAAAAAPGGTGDEDMLRIPSGDPDPEAWAGLRQQRDALLHALALLPSRDRLLIQLRYGRDLTLEQVARAVGLDTAQSADRHIREAIGKLRNALAERGKRAKAVRVMGKTGD